MSIPFVHAKFLNRISGNFLLSAKFYFKMWRPSILFCLVFVFVSDADGFYVIKHFTVN